MNLAAVIKCPSAKTTCLMTTRAGRGLRRLAWRLCPADAVVCAAPVDAGEPATAAWPAHPVEPTARSITRAAQPLVLGCNCGVDLLVMTAAGEVWLSRQDNDRVCRYSFCLMLLAGQ